MTAPTDNCTAGFYCTLGAIVAAPNAEVYGTVCPAGHYCPEGTGVPKPCSVGTYLPDTQRDELSDCLDCPGGMYCDVQGLTNYTGMTFIPFLVVFAVDDSLIHLTRLLLSLNIYIYIWTKKAHMG